MRHHILVKWKEGCKPGLEPIRELFQETLAIPGVESVELHPNVIDRPNRYDLLILLCMEKGALEAIAEKAIERQIGARGLRAIMEEIMTKIMYEIPSDPTIQSVCITERCVREGEPPQITRDAAKPRAPIKNAGVTL